jgi:hypothetical protein
VRIRVLLNTEAETTKCYALAMSRMLCFVIGLFFFEIARGYKCGCKIESDDYYVVIDDATPELADSIAAKLGFDNKGKVSTVKFFNY